jgi:hypothetical protein
MIEHTLNRGDFVRVKTASEFRPGQDGMVIDAGDGAEVGLMFGCDRFNRGFDNLGITFTGLIEAWNVDELDLPDVAH